MSARKSIKVNYLLNLGYQIFLIIVPVLLTPYVSRVLGVEAVGRYSFSYSIVSYFILFAALGFDNYAQRLVASHQGDLRKQSVDFWSVFLARLIPTGLTLAVYFALAAAGVFGDKYTLLMLIWSVDIIAVACDVSFFFKGNEDFARIVLLSGGVRLLAVVSIFSFVRDEGDLPLYVGIQAAAMIITNLSLWFFLRGRITGVRLKELTPLRHMGPVLILFLPTIATTVYTSLDKTMIGLITGSDTENGLYEYAERIVKICMTVITSLGTVMIPHNSQSFAQGDMEAIENNIFRSCRYVFFLGVPMMLGMTVTASNLIPWYLGPGYEGAAFIMALLSPIVLIIGLSNVFGQQFMIPCHMDRSFTLGVSSGAISNFCLNLLLIPFFGARGAALGTVGAELIVTMVMYMFIKDHVDPAAVLRASKWYICAGLIMTAALIPLSLRLPPSVLHTFVMAAVGAGIYFGLLLLVRDDFVLEGLMMIRGRFIGRRR